MTPDQMRSSSPSAKPKEKELSTGAAEPIIIDLGKKTRKQLRRLRKGRPGRLMNRIEDAMAHLQENGALGASAQPIVVIVKERSRRRNRRIARMWGLG